MTLIYYSSFHFVFRYIIQAVREPGQERRRGTVVAIAGSQRAKETWYCVCVKFALCGLSA